jgi:P4 family phage/plasmid primase-like protien
VAKLHGFRLVVAQETEKGRKWDEAKIKTMTGGDKMTARFMRQDYFDFVPKFKLFIVGNHKPRLDNVDEAMRRRLLLVPFTVQIPPEERDPELPEKLKAEWPAILRWMIDGCLEWQKIGLAPPKIVTDATDEYFNDQDTLKQWLEDCTGWWAFRVHRHKPALRLLEKLVRRTQPQTWERQYALGRARGSWLRQKEGHWRDERLSRPDGERPERLCQQ